MGKLGDLEPGFGEIWEDYSHLKAVSVVSGSAARGHEAPEVTAPRHAPAAYSTLSMRSSHAPLTPTVSPARGHEDVVTVHHLVRKGI